MKTIVVEILTEKESKNNNTELSKIKGPRGWITIPSHTKENITKIIYLGKCGNDGDTFAIYWCGFISLAKGKFNNGIYVLPKH